MSRITPQILGITLLSLVFIHGLHVGATSQPQEASDPRGQQESTAQLNQDPTFDQLNRELKGGSMGPDIGEQQQLPTSAAINHDDYHSNIDLDKINEAYRYEMLDGDGPNGGSTIFSNHYATSDNSYNDNNNPLAGPMQGTLIGRMLVANNNANNNLNKNNYNNNNNNRRPLYGAQLARTFLKTKRFPRYGLSFNPAKEDKDYTFVGLQPTTGLADGGRAATMNQDLASRVSLLATDVLRDWSLANQAKNRLRNLDQLSSTYLRNLVVEPSPASNEIVANTNREKRRRCKVDPNLGVKNPSFCDTDAYFGAAAYNMRDVWDSAGRRR